MINGYYDRFDSSKNYDKHLFRAGYVLQSAEMNEIQSRSQDRLKGVTDALFNDGDVIRDAGIFVDVAKGTATLESGAVYLSGAVRGVAPAVLTVPMSGTVVIGVYLKQEVITELEDPDLRDPAVGVRNYKQAGAARLQITPVWGHSTDGQTGEFYPVHSIENGIARVKEPPPQMDSVTQALATYDRDSSGGNYVVSGMDVKFVSNGAGDIQTLTVSEGRVRVNGFAQSFPSARRIVYAAEPDLKLIDSEPVAADGSASQRVDLDRSPLASIVAIKITAEKTATMTHGAYAGAADTLPDESVLKIVSIKQGNTTFILGTDYRLLGGAVDWSLPGAEPNTGTSYQVTYQYITAANPTAVDDSGYSVSGAVAGSLILTTYYAKMPRIDRLCLNESGDFTWVKGTPSFAGVSPPSVSGSMLPLASIQQTWKDSTRLLQADGVRMVSMGDLQAINSRIDYLINEISVSRLTADVSARDSGVRRGLFVDPLLDDSMRDSGMEQTAAIVDGELTLPMLAVVGAPSSDVKSPVLCGFTQVQNITQTARTTTMKVNPYMAFDPLPASCVLTPAVDRWTDVETTWASPVTERFSSGYYYYYWYYGYSTTSSVSQRLLSSSTAAIENLRQISVAFALKGFGPGEAISRIIFDGIDVVPNP